MLVYVARILVRIIRKAIAMARPTIRKRVPNSSKILLRALISSPPLRLEASLFTTGRRSTIHAFSFFDLKFFQEKAYTDERSKDYEW